MVNIFGNTQEILKPHLSFRDLKAMHTVNHLMIHQNSPLDRGQ